MGMCLWEKEEQSHASKCVCPHLDMTCSWIQHVVKFSDWRQKEKLDHWESAHLQRFLWVGRALLRWFTEKLKMFLGKLCWTLDHKPFKFWHEFLITDEIAKPWDKGVSFIRSSWSCWIDLRTCLVFWNWSYWRFVP